MNKEEILSGAFAKRVVNKNDGKIGHELQKIHFELFGKYFKVNCGPCIKSAYIKIKEKLNSNDMIISTTNQNAKTMSNFKIKVGKNKASKQIHTGTDVITNDNLTDEKAIAILAKAPGHIATFSEKPDNWQELVAEYKKNGPKKAAKKEAAPAPAKEEAKKEEAPKVEEKKEAPAKPEAPKAEKKAAEAKKAASKKKPTKKKK